MKRLIFTVFLYAVTTNIYAHGADLDTARSRKDTVKHGYHIFFDKKEKVLDQKVIKDSTKYTYHKAPGFSYGLTFSRFDLGLATLVDNGSFKLSPQNQFLNYRSWKTSNVGF